MEDQNIIHGEDTLSVPNISLGQYFLNNLKMREDTVAQVDIITGETQTFPEILNKSVRLAHHMRELGIRQGDVVGVSSENNLDFCIPVLAAFYLGAACAPLNPAYTEAELLHAMSISRPRMVFASALTVNYVVGAASKLDCVRDIILIGRQSPKSLPCQIRRLADFIFSSQFQNVPLIPAQVDTEETCLILCSSGTTGLPKGVELSHKNYLYFIYLAVETSVLPLSGPKESLLGLLPFYHGYGFGLLSFSFAHGHKVIVFPRFEEELFLRAVAEHKVSVLYVVPPLMVFLGKHPIVDKYDLSHVHTIVCGAAPLSKEAQEAVAHRLGVKDIRQGYGMTETSVLATACKGGTNKMGCSGRILAGLHAKVVDLETGKSLPRHKEGEICLKGPVIMKGYRNNPQATMETIDKDGWLHTGDIGYFDKDGDLFVVDRLKELIKYKAFQVPPAELEAILYTHKAVRDACVVGKKDDISGEVPTAFVVLQPNAKVTEKEIADYVNERVSPQKKLRGGVIFISEIPRNPSGKLLRRVLRSKL